MSRTLRQRALPYALALVATLAGAASTAEAATLRFDTDPFAGTDVLQRPGRQVVAGEQFVTGFDLATDRIEVASGVFDFGPEVAVFNGFAAALPEGGFNFVVLRDLRFDGASGGPNALNAVQAADLIAARVTQAGAGFFIYFNSALNQNRLVYSTDLSSSTADLKIIARFEDQKGAAGLAALQEWGPQLAAVPEPATWSLMILGFGLAGAAMRRRRLATV